MAEIKRLYVRPDFRGCRVGQQLLERVMEEARIIGYSHLWLDTVPSEMAKAVDLYRSFGFQEIKPYRENPQPGVLYMEFVVHG